MPDLLLARVLVENRHAHRQANKGMAIEIGLAIVLGMVVQNAHTVEMLAPLGNGLVTDASIRRALTLRALAIVPEALRQEPILLIVRLTKAWPLK